MGKPEPSWYTYRSPAAELAGLIFHSTLYVAGMNVAASFARIQDASSDNIAESRFWITFGFALTFSTNLYVTGT
ncbi:hypothetical protein HGRIS_008911 [Hohenbuehelia grisea]|uniref:Uncharacterized protein n=1 Tax=Hohenbuehelia grisea TaxID=104357 RepID=A0ABR3IZH7_9AGAR